MTSDDQRRKVDLWTAATLAEPDVYDVAARVSTVPDVAVAVVRFANSAHLGAVYPVGTVLEAVIRVGCRGAGALAMASLNRDLVDAWGVSETWEDTLVVARAAKLVGRLNGLPRLECELLFVAGLFSAAGSAALGARDEGFAGWRRQQLLRGLTDRDLLSREEMAYGETHVTAAASLLEDWNMPAYVVSTIALHHAPVSPAERSLWAAMTALDDSSPVRCLRTTLTEALQTLGLGDHVRFVDAEARLFAEVAGHALDTGSERATA